MIDQEQIYYNPVMSTWDFLYEGRRYPFMCESSARNHGQDIVLNTTDRWYHTPLPWDDYKELRTIG